jgi:hypothetical protein
MQAPQRTLANGNYWTIVAVAQALTKKMDFYASPKVFHFKSGFLLGWQAANLFEELEFGQLSLQRLQAGLLIHRLLGPTMQTVTTPTWCRVEASEEHKQSKEASRLRDREREREREREVGWGQ